MLRPSPGNITGPYTATHRALDFGHGHGYEVVAAHGGFLRLDRSPGYGLRASVVDGNRITRYAHLATSSKKTTIDEGDWLGEQGSSGTFAKYDHLHFELLQRVGSGFAKVNPTHLLTSPAGGTGSPIEPETEYPTMKLIYNIDDPNDATRRALVGEQVFQPLSAAAAAEERELWGAPINVSGANFARYKARAEARRGTSETGLTEAQREQLAFDISSRIQVPTKGTITLTQ